MVFKYYVYRSRDKDILHIDILIDTKIKNNKNKELKKKQISLVSNYETEIYDKKWCITDNVLPVN